MVEQGSGEAVESRASTVTSAVPSRRVSVLDQALWRQLVEAEDWAVFLASWLALQCQAIPGARAGLVLRGEPDGSDFARAAAWPDGHAATATVTAAARIALANRRGIVNDYQGPEQRDPCGVAYPFLIDGKLHGAVAVELDAPEKSELSQIMRQLQWGSAWVELRLRRASAEDRDRALDRTTTVLGIIATALEEERANAACSATVTELATRLGCDRVSIGFLRGGRTRVAALSHSAHFGKHMNLMSGLAKAMDEAVDQRTTILYPEQADAHVVISAAHAELAATSRSRCICTVPLTVDERYCGAITLERPAGDPFDPPTVELVETVAAVLGPILDEKRSNDRWLIVKASDSLRAQGARLFGPRHVGRKAVVLGLLALVAVLVVADGTYRVTADARLEGTIRRAVAAPIHGYIRAENARAGDTVEAGRVLATLDDRDLVLEHRSWTTVRRQRLREFDKALAQGDRAEINIIRAQIEQAEAQIALLDEQLARTELKAPFDGMIISGDLSQKIGASVDRGQVLFEIAPLDSYRVILEVDEAAIADVAVGQTGRLVLAAMPEEPLSMAVDRITPIAFPKDGRNVFVVEGRLEDSSTRLRPGMEGVGKIEVDRRRLLWIWTHKLVDYVRLLAWTWWP